MAAILSNALLLTGPDAPAHPATLQDPLIEDEEGAHYRVWYIAVWDLAPQWRKGVPAAAESPESGPNQQDADIPLLASYRLSTFVREIQVQRSSRSANVLHIAAICPTVSSASEEQQPASARVWSLDLSPRLGNIEFLLEASSAIFTDRWRLDGHYIAFAADGMIHIWNWREDLWAVFFMPQGAIDCEGVDLLDEYHMLVFVSYGLEPTPCEVHIYELPHFHEDLRRAEVDAQRSRIAYFPYSPPGHFTIPVSSWRPRTFWPTQSLVLLVWNHEIPEQHVAQQNAPDARFLRMELSVDPQIATFSIQTSVAAQMETATSSFAPDLSTSCMNKKFVQISISHHSQRNSGVRTLKLIDPSPTKDGHGGTAKQYPSIELRAGWSNIDLYLVSPWTGEALLFPSQSETHGEDGVPVIVFDLLAPTLTTTASTS